jgi:acyl-CoA thioester hydrolase
VQPALRDTFPVLRELDTRWMDNDVYGHVNNVVYYSYFDTVVNAYLMENGVLGSTAKHNAIGLVVETTCSYFSSISFPGRITVGLRVARIGNSSVYYELAVFRASDQQAAAQGRFVHVYVDRDTRRPVAALPADLHNLLTAIHINVEPA